MIQGFTVNSQVVFIMLIAIGFYSFSIYAGIQLTKHQEKKVLSSQILQYLQLMAVSIGGVTYILTSGGNFFIGYNFTNSLLELNFSVIASEFQINLMSNEQNDFVYINIMAIAILLIIEKAVGKIKELNAVQESYLNCKAESMTEYNHEL